MILEMVWIFMDFDNGGSDFALALELVHQWAHNSTPWISGFLRYCRANFVTKVLIGMSHLLRGYANPPENMLRVCASSGFANPRKSDQPGISPLDGQDAALSPFENKPFGCPDSGRAILPN